MESSRIQSMMENIYIPEDKSNKPAAIPQHHPSLIMQDKLTDTTHHMSCGCCKGGVCIANAWWNKNGEDGSSSSAPADNFQPIQPMRSNCSSTSTSSTNSL